MSEDVKEMREQKMAVPMAGGTMPKESDEERLTRLAGEINAIKEQTRATVQTAPLELGRRLIQAPAAEPHGRIGARHRSITPSARRRCS